MAKRGSKKKKATEESFGGMPLDALLANLPPLPPGMTQEMALEALRDIMSGHFPQFAAPSPPPRAPRKKRNTKTPEGRALALVDKAEAAEEDVQRIDYLERALKEDPDCVAALLALALDAPSADDAVALYEHALRAGERKLGPNFEQRYAGQFQTLEATGEYLTALIGSGRRYFDLQRYDDAIASFTRLLKLAPDAPSEVKAELLAVYLDMEQNDEAQRLVDAFPLESGVLWKAGCMLLAFRRSGDSAPARELFKEVYRDNPLAISMLLHEDEAEDEPPRVSDVEGTYENAETVAALYMRSWPISPGGLAWLRQMQADNDPQRGKPDDLPPWPQLAYELSTLGRSGETWLVDLIPSEPPQRGKKTGWTTMICDADDMQPIGVHILDRKPAIDEILSQLGQTMLGVYGEEPRLPERVLVREAALAKKLAPKLKRHHIDCEAGGEWSYFDEMATQLLRAQRSTSTGLDLPEVPSAELAELPLEPGEVWQVDVRRAAAWAMDVGVPQRMNIALVCMRGERYIVQQQLFGGTLSAEQLWAFVSQAIGQPSSESPHRPGTIEVGSAAHFAALAPRLEQIGVDCVQVEKLETIEEAMESLTGFLQEKHGQDNPAVATAPGVTDDALRYFYQAAAVFFKERVWRWALPDQRINISSSDLSCGSVDVMVMGQLGEVFGVAVHEDREALSKMLTEHKDEPFDEADHAAQKSFRSAYLDQSGMSILFGEAMETAFADLDAIEARGYEIAAPEAYPKVLHFEHGILRSPLAWEIDLLTGILQGLSNFVKTQRHNASANEFVITPQGKKLTFRWVK